MQPCGSLSRHGESGYWTHARRHDHFYLRARRLFIFFLSSHLTSSAIVVSIDIVVMKCRHALFCHSSAIFIRSTETFASRALGSAEIHEMCGKYCDHCGSSYADGGRRANCRKTLRDEEFSSEYICLEHNRCPP